MSHSPSLRTGRADLPHPALQSVVCTCKRSDERSARRIGAYLERPATKPPRHPSHHHEPASRPALSAPSTTNRVPNRHSPKALGWGIYAAVRPGSSTFLRSLRSRPITALLRYYGRSDSCLLRRASARPFASGQPFGSSQAGLPDSRPWPSGHSVSKHLRTLRLVQSGHVILSTGRTEIASPRVFSQRELGASPLGGRLAASHRPNRVQFPLLSERLLTDWTFTSCCSPPRLATTRLQSVTSCVDLERTFTSPTKCALRRTTHRFAVPPLPQAGEGCYQLTFRSRSQM
jgi:hypothetical protein